MPLPLPLLAPPAAAFPLLQPPRATGNSLLELPGQRKWHPTCTPQTPSRLRAVSFARLYPSQRKIGRGGKLTSGSKPTSPMYVPSRFTGRLRKGTASEKSPCMRRELLAAGEGRGVRGMIQPRLQSSGTQSHSARSTLCTQSTHQLKSPPPPRGAAALNPPSSIPLAH